ncbi:hypothetical protein AQUCO_04000074v1 [Aquilegia coerulea]|uniref:Uncharacterized protein n=1 Tax=Aquilegia coerulea TaxID=218851 RepID=A0A2G5CR25_AQUCA|nr:hypothetical protein AQUCO_04000074v1 [Aquilegia coerulea]
MGMMQSKINNMEDMMKVVLEQVTLTNMTTGRANSPNATTPTTEVASSSLPRAHIIPTNLMNSYVHVHQSDTPQRVFLLNRNKEVVAIGVMDTENGGICHGREVDDGEVKVYVEKVFDGSTPIYDGPQNSCTTLDDIADGGYLIWLKARLRYER